MTCIQKFIFLWAAVLRKSGSNFPLSKTATFYRYLYKASLVLRVKTLPGHVIPNLLKISLGWNEPCSKTGNCSLLSAKGIQIIIREAHTDILLDEFCSLFLYRWKGKNCIESDKQFGGSEKAFSTPFSITNCQTNGEVKPK